jgi:hypothetical protein
MPQLLPKRIASMISLSRAKVMRSEWSKEDRRVRRKYPKGNLPADAGLPILVRWLAFLSLWFASLYVLVQGYRRSSMWPDSLLQDAEIDVLLDAKREATLTLYRNAVVHPELYDHPDLSEVQLKYKSYCHWASRLTDAFERLLVERLHQPAPPRGSA